MNPFHILCHLVPILKTRHHIIFLLPSWGNWGTERLWDLFQVPPLVSGRGGVPSNTGWSPNLCFQWALFTLQCALRSPGDPVKNQVLIQQIWGEAQDTVSQQAPRCCRCCWLMRHTLCSKNRTVPMTSNIHDLLCFEIFPFFHFSLALIYWQNSES